MKDLPLKIIMAIMMIIIGTFFHATACDDRIVECCCDFPNWCVYCDGDLCESDTCFSTAWCRCYDTGVYDEVDCPQYG